MRLRCARCGCYVSKRCATERYVLRKRGMSGYEVTWHVEPCARCLREAAHRYKEAVLEAMIKILWME